MNITSIYENKMTKDFRFLKSIPVMTPSASSVSNYQLCYGKTDTTGTAKWNLVPDAWVIVAPSATCSDPDCIDSDFSSGMSSSFFDSLYFSLIIQSTIGYGDIVAVSNRAKMVTTLQMLMMMAISVV
eukprot:c21326_g1_i3.p1 GENE.c21326_g1_i3~~c21326_g1_i3.p1  ORF type:complete len:127 (+),score=47.74 c21326_g1_i3:106-486(+)